MQQSFWVCLLQRSIGQKPAKNRSVPSQAIYPPCELVIDISTKSLSIGRSIQGDLG
jgi:hypothetical protein